MQTSVEPLAGGTLLQAIVARVDLSPAVRAFAVLFATVATVAAAQVSIPLPFTPVPFTLQPMVVLLAGAASPVLPQGLARLLGPTGGYLMSYPFAAFVAGYLAERGFDRRYLTS